VPSGSCRASPNLTAIALFRTCRDACAHADDGVRHQEPVHQPDDGSSCTPSLGTMSELPSALRCVSPCAQNNHVPNRSVPRTRAFQLETSRGSWEPASGHFSFRTWTRCSVPESAPNVGIPFLVSERPRSRGQLSRTALNRCTYGHLDNRWPIVPSRPDSCRCALSFPVHNAWSNTPRRYEGARTAHTNATSGDPGVRTCR
jgi:hypothetical protein